MTVLANQIIETPGAPKVECHPSITLGAMNPFTVGAGVQAYIPKTTDLTAVGVDWLTGPRCLLSGEIFASHATAGGFFVCETSLDGLTFNRLFSLPLRPATIEYFAGIEIPGYTCRLGIGNRHTADQGFYGLLMLRAY